MQGHYSVLTVYQTPDMGSHHPQSIHHPQLGLTNETSTCAQFQQSFTTLGRSGD